MVTVMETSLLVTQMTILVLSVMIPGVAMMQELSAGSLDSTLALLTQTLTGEMFQMTLPWMKWLALAVRLPYSSVAIEQAMIVVALRGQEFRVHNVLFHVLTHSMY